MYCTILPFLYIDNILYFLVVCNTGFKKFFCKFFCYSKVIYLYKMKKLNSTNIFALFEVTDEQVYAQHQSLDVLQDPVVRFGTMIKAVENYQILDTLHTVRLGEQYLRHRDSVCIKYFTSTMQYVEPIHNIATDTLFIINQQFTVEQILGALRMMISVFEKHEYYEYCSILSKYFNFFSEKSCIHTI